MPLNTGYLTSSREKNELYSPFYIVDHIMKYLPKDKVIWCPFDENWSAFYRRLKEGGFKVVRSSLLEGQDFFEFEPNEWDIIVSNPPFSVKDKVLERLYSFNKPFAILLPLNALQGKTRYSDCDDCYEVHFTKNGEESTYPDGYIGFYKMKRDDYIAEKEKSVNMILEKFMRPNV